MDEIELRTAIASYNELIGFTDNMRDDYFAMRNTVSQITANLNQIISDFNAGEFSPQFGTGSPEGVVTSNKNRTYFDTSGAQAIMYINENAGVNTGWQEVQ